MIKNKEIYKIIPKIISKFYYIDMENQITNAENHANTEIRKLNDKNKELSNTYNQMVFIKEKEKKELQKEIKKLKDSGLSKDKALQDIKVKCSNLKKELDEERKNTNVKIATAKGGFTKEINKQKALVEAEKETVKSYTKKLEVANLRIKELENKNQVQQAKIKEMTENQKHISEEYQNDGLPQSTKKALKGRIKKKQTQIVQDESKIKLKSESTPDLILKPGELELKPTNDLIIKIEPKSNITTKEKTTKKTLKKKGFRK